MAEIGGAFLLGLLSGMAVFWMRLRCLQAKVRVLDYYFRERMKQQWEDCGKALVELGAGRLHTAA